jgi:hypothetical protein
VAARHGGDGPAHGAAPRPEAKQVYGAGVGGGRPDEPQGYQKRASEGASC